MIVFVNGSFNAGKSTVAKLLAQKIENAAVVEVESFHDFIDWMPIKESVLINLENATLVIRNFVKRGFNVIVPYPLSKQTYEYMTEKLKDIEDEVYIFNLNPDIREVLGNRGNNKLTEAEIERIKYHYSIGINNSPFGKTINSTNQTPEETAEVILNSIILK